MKTKDLSKELSGLVDAATGPFGMPGTGGGMPSSSGSGYSAAYTARMGEDELPAELQDPEPAFVMNYKGEQKQCVKKAKDSIMIIVKEVVPEQLQNTALIQDKVNQDAEQLGNLYYQYKKKEVVHQTLMDTIARGETNSKMFDSFEKMSKSLEDLGSKITETQNQLRKYYIDTYLDIQRKDETDEAMLALGAKPAEEPKEIAPEAKMQNVIVGTDDTIKFLAEKRKQMMRAKYEEASKEGKQD